MKQFIAFARVSSDEQKKHGYSLEVQEGTLREFAKKQKGEVVQLYRVAETASKKDVRKTFNEMLEFARKNASKLDGIIFDRVDRAARNIFDLAKLEELRDGYHLKMYFASQNIDSTTPEGELMLTIMGGTARFQVRQAAQKIRDNMLKRVESGLFACKAPYGYKNVQVKGRSVIEVDVEKAARVRRIFQLYAYGNLTLDSLNAALLKEGVVYTNNLPKFTRSKLHEILTDRAYIGEVFYRELWYPGTHEKLVDVVTFKRIQALLGSGEYRSHEMTYAGELIRCKHCGHPITGETKIKKTKKGPKEYQYYRCGLYNRPDHPRVRLTEADLDKQVLALFAKVRLEDEEKRQWVVDVLKAKAGEIQEHGEKRLVELQRQHATNATRQSELLSMRLSKEITPEQYAEKSAELRDKEAELRLQIEACDRGRAEDRDLAVKAFELSQNLAAKWLTADFSEKRTILKILFLNFSLEGASLCATWRKPFEVLAELPVLNDGIPTRI